MCDEAILPGVQCCVPSSQVVQEEPRFKPYDGRVHGVLYRVTKEDFDKLSKREGGYVVQEVEVGAETAAIKEANADCLRSVDQFGAVLAYPLGRLTHVGCPNPWLNPHLGGGWIKSRQAGTTVHSQAGMPTPALPLSWRNLPGP